MTKPKDPKDYLPMGRPTDYKPEYCEIARELLKQGLSIVEIAAHFDVNRSTLYEWCNSYPNFSDTINKDIDLSESWWTKAGRENLANKEFNSRLYELNMMNRFGWNKKSEQKHDVNVKQEDALKELS